MVTYRLPPPACAKQPLAHALARPMYSLSNRHYNIPEYSAVQHNGYSGGDPITIIFYYIRIASTVATQQKLVYSYWCGI